jgi:polysaccharide biosynthesis protein PslH
MSGGTRLKVLEGMSMAKTVVSTSVSCEGVGVLHWEPVLIRDEPRALANRYPQVLMDCKDCKDAG